MEYFLPLPVEDQQSFQLSKRPESPVNLTIGLLDNTKKNADLLLQAFSSLISEKYKSITFKYYRKPNSSTPYKGIPNIAMECDFVLNAHGD